MSVTNVPYQINQRNQIIKPFNLNYYQSKSVKRVFDLSFCILLLPFLLLPMALICLAVVLDSRGCPIFIQERIGKNGRRFNMYKFRSMRRDIDDSNHRAFMQSFVAGNISEPSETDDRAAKFKPIQQKEITRVGRLLRKTSLDELPQIINVIKGEMSLVGPRPNVPWEVDAYRTWHYDRLKALPGITGLAQVMGRSDISFDDIVRYDILYVKNKMLHLDFWILFQTVSAVFKGEGAG